MFAIAHVEKAQASVSIETIRKSAEGLIRFMQSEDSGARMRFVRQGFDPRKLKPRELRNAAQNVVAREERWLDLASIEKLLADSLRRESLENTIIVDAIYNKRSHIKEIHDNNALTTGFSAAVNLVMLNEDILQSFNTGNVNEPLAPFFWEPLVYLCCSCIGNDDVNLTTRRIQMARDLLALGGNPNAGMLESDTIRGYCTVLGGSIGHARSARLAEVLLEAGADINDGPTLYEGCAMWHAIVKEDVASLQILLDAKPPLWHICHALPHSLSCSNRELFKMLLAAGADTNWDKTIYGYGGSSLHEAVMVGCSDDELDALITSGAKVDATDKAGRHPYDLAYMTQRISLMETLVRSGADRSGIGNFEKWVAACFRQKEGAAEEALKALASDAERKPEDNMWLCEALREGLTTTFKLLLHGGLDPNEPDYNGNTAFHIAAETQNIEAINLLLLADADSTITNFAGESVVDVAIRSTDQPSSDVLRALSSKLPEESKQMPSVRLSYDEQDQFEHAAESISTGNIGLLRKLLDEYPHFVHARSPRPHCCTLMNYVGVNGFEGERQQTPENILAIINLLLDRGSDPNALCFTYRGGAGNNTIGLLTSSGMPQEAGLTMPMVHALYKGGAELDRGWEVLVGIYDARLEDRLEAFVSSLDPTASETIGAFIEMASHGEITLVRLLAETGVDVNGTSWGNVTALHQAAISGNRALVDLLLELGADPTIRDNQFDGTATGWANAGGHDELAKHIWQIESSYSSTP